MAEEMGELPDEVLVQRAVGGDAAAFEQLFGRHYTMVYQAAFRLVGSRDDAQDIAQETFLRVARSLNSYRSEAKLKTWIYSIAINVVSDWRKRLAKNRTLLEEFSRESYVDTPDERSRQVLQALSQLTEKERAAITLSVYQGLTHAEVAQALLNGIAQDLVQVLVTQLSTRENLLLAERAELDKLLSEQELTLSGTIDAQTALTVGRLTGAKILITGRVFAVQNQVAAVAKLMSAETSRVFGEMIMLPREQFPLPAAEQLAEKIAKTVTTKGADLLAKAVPHDLGQLKAALAGKTLPVVSVTFSPKESHSTTAQTELVRILREVGITVVEQSAAPEVTITGTVVASQGLRKGNLVSARARLELTAQDLQSSRVIAADRQAEVALDLAPSIAEKLAVERSTEKLAERFLPQLVR